MGNWAEAFEFCNMKKVLVAGFLVMLAFLLIMRSPLNCINSGISGTDSSVFRYVAFVMSKGGMPYKDAFDHKGPLLYLINYLGLMVSYNHGVWCMEFVFMAVFLVCAYKIARLFCGRGVSCFLTAVAVAPLEYYYEGGNLTEEYAMPFLAIALYLFIDYFLNEKINSFRLILCGGCFSAVLMLRANMISVWMVFCIAVLVWNIKQKRAIPWNFLLWFLVGCMIVMLPIVIWLLYGKAFSYFVNDYLLFNLRYISYEERSNLYNKYNSTMNFLNCNLLLVSIVALLYLIREKNKCFFDSAYLIYVVVTLLSVSMSGMSYGHYGMILIPLFLYPLSRAYVVMVSEERGHYAAMSYTILLLFMAFTSWKSNLDTLANGLHIRYTQQESTPLSEEEKVLMWVVTENTSEAEPILVIGNKNSYYLESRRLAASRFSYQLPIAKIANDIREEFVAELVREKPKIIIVQNCTSEEYMNLFVTIDEYELLYVADERVGIYRIKGIS
ncbi:MAG: hypothetical protein K2N44_17575 [Lachnospiraceae bacterium]|nr:hypothetical protein [Lachnospiraceae bacterium]